MIHGVVVLYLVLNMLRLSKRETNTRVCAQILICYIDNKILEVLTFPWCCRKDFAAYAEVCFREFGDRVRYWATINEPNIFAIGGYDQGIAPPRRCSPPFGLRNCSAGNSTSEPYLAAHNTLLSHASAAKLYREKYQVY